MLKNPGPQHNKLLIDLQGVLERYQAQGMPIIETIAIASQAIGAQISDLNPLEFTSTADVLESVMLNIISGNESKGVGVVGHG